MRALWPLLLLPALHSYYAAVPLIPRQHHRQLDVRLIAPTPLEPEIVAPPEEPPPPAAGLAGLVAPTSASSRLPALSADDLWGLLQGDLIAHLEPAERVRIRLAIDVLLSKISMAERAERGQPVRRAVLLQDGEEQRQQRCPSGTMLSKIGSKTRGGA